jgi:EmrB/QacA subfamily drug resistance transporter
VLGGLILAVGDWRWLFLLNVPFCVVGGVLAIRNLAKDEGGTRQRLDVVGLFLISPAVIGIVFGLSRVAADGGFSSPSVVIPIGAGLVLLVAFVAWALRHRGTALIDLRLFRYRTLASGSALGFLAAATLYGAIFLLPLYWQEADGRSALETGVLLIPQSIGTLLSRRIAGNWTDRFGPRSIALIGFVIVTVATVPFAFVSRGTNIAVLLVALLVRGAGMGFAIIPLTGASFIGLAREEMPHASIISRVAQQVGGSVGTAVIAIALTSASADATGTTSLYSAFDQAFWWTIGCTALAAPLCLSLPGKVEGATTAPVRPAQEGS